MSWKSKHKIMQLPRNLNDVLSGIFMILTALVGLYSAWPLDSFSSFGLGPGYVPKMFALMLIAFGLAITVHGFVGASEASESWHFRPLALILGSIAFFGVTVERLGLFVALIGLVIIACAAHRRTKLYESAALGIIAATFSYFVFIKGIGLTIPVWPTIQWGQ
jgi:putative tricarboxylic transport membrane protein